MAFCLLPPLYANSTSQKLKFSTEISNPIEIVFLIAQEEARNGRYSNAIRLFESLCEVNPTPRIQLELARVYFLDRRFHASKALFAELYNRRDIPWSVRQNIRLYLDSIDDVLGSIRLNFSFVSDSNPRRFTDSRQVRIYGQLFTVIPPSDNKEIKGVRYSLSLAKDLSGNGSINGYLNVVFSDYEMSQFDRWMVDAGFAITPRSNPKIKFKLGLEESFYGGEHLYDFPYFGITFVPQPVDEFKIRSDFKVGELRVPNVRGFDATNVSLSVKALRQISDNSSLLTGLYLEESIAEKDFYSYYGGGVGVDLGMELWRNVVLSPFLSVSRRVYDSRNPIFGRTRQDVKREIGFKIKKSDLRVVDFTPELIIRYDYNTSNISYYSYDKTLALLNWSM